MKTFAAGSANCLKRGVLRTSSACFLTRVREDMSVCGENEMVYSLYLVYVFCCAPTPCRHLGSGHDHHQPSIGCEYRQNRRFAVWKMCKMRNSASVERRGRTARVMRNAVFSLAVQRDVAQVAQRRWPSDASALLRMSLNNQT